MENLFLDIYSRIADRLASQILEGKIYDGEDILVDALGDELIFTAMENVEKAV